ncbi:hypothetical protein Bbelb_291460 [Branchiostoma belcheri]|nr:hypothetical protein Bbelb_291460 [Branchiostoma belcheri]
MLSGSCPNCHVTRIRERMRWQAWLGPKTRGSTCYNTEFGKKSPEKRDDSSTKQTSTSTCLKTDSWTYLVRADEEQSTIRKQSTEKNKTDSDSSDDEEEKMTKEKRTQIDMAILDFSKAFDSVPHIRLLKKLEYYGIRGKTLQWIKNWLIDRYQQVVVDGDKSKPVKLEYASTVWGPHKRLHAQTNKLEDKVEAVQKRAARFVTGDYRPTTSMSDTLRTLGWPSLHQRRQQARLVLMYKAVNNMVAIPIHNILTKNTNITRGHHSRFITIPCKTEAYRASYFPRTVIEWNTLPDNTLYYKPNRCVLFNRAEFGSEVKYTPGKRTPKYKTPGTSAVINFNRDLDSALRGAEEAETNSGGGAYSIVPEAAASPPRRQTPRKTPVKKRSVPYELDDMANNNDSLSTDLNSPEYKDDTRKIMKIISAPGQLVHCPFNPAHVVKCCKVEDHFIKCSKLQSATQDPLLAGSASGFDAPVSLEIDLQSWKNNQRAVIERRQRQRRLLYLGLAVAQVMHAATIVDRAIWERDRSKNRWDETVVGTFTDADWQENFRVSRLTFDYLCDQLRARLQRRRIPVPVEKRVAVALWTLGHLFGVAKSTVCEFVHEVCQAIVHELKKQYIRIPKGQHLREVVETFEDKWQFPQCAGAIDGTHIQAVRAKSRRTEMVLSGDKHTRRDWLHSRAAEIVGLVFAEDIRIATEITHELKKHNLVVNETVESSSDTSKEHYVFNYHNAKLGMSLLLTNIQDVTKEGDGERVARYLRMAHFLLWNRFVNTRGGGKNIAGDLRLEHMNNLLKSLLKRRKRLDRLGTLGQQEHGSGHSRFGIKLWVLADSTNGYISRFEVYRSHDLLKMVRTLQATVDGLRRGNLGVRAIFRDIRSAQTAHLIPSAVQREKMLWMWSPVSSRGQPTAHPARGAGVRTHRPRGGYRRTCVSLLRHLQFGPAD